MLEVLPGRAQEFDTTAGDNLLDLVGFTLLAAVTQPLVFWIVSKIGLRIAPEYQDALINLPWWAGAALFLVDDDMLQYWWHRISHSPLLWPLYRVKALEPLMWLVQRTISTPTTHFAHHAMTNADGIGHY